MKTFQICALPRSGTAFLATMFNLHDGVYCDHELSAYDPNWRETRVTPIADIRFRGTCATSLEEWQCFSPSKLVTVLRCYEECADSYEKAFGIKVPYDKAEKDMIHLMDLFANKEKKIILFSLLFKPYILKTIFEHCCPSEVFQTKKVEQLLRMNVQRNDFKQMKEAICH